MFAPVVANATLGHAAWIGDVDNPYRLADRTMRPLIRITGYALRYKWLSVAAATVGTLNVFPQLAIPRLLGIAIDEVLTGESEGKLLFLAGITLLVSLSRGGLFYASLYMIEAVGNRVSYELRKDFFRKLLGLSVGFYDKQQTGNLMSRATVDVEAVHFYVGFGFLGIFRSIATFIVAAAMMLMIDWRLALVSMAFVPILIWLSVNLALAMAPLFRKAHEETGLLNTVVQENLAGIRVVKAFAAGEYEGGKFRGGAREVATYLYRAGRVMATRQAAVTFVLALATAAILLYGGSEVFAGRLSPGELAAFILYMGVLAFPIQILGWRIGTAARALAASRRIYEVLDAEPHVKERPGAKSLQRVAGHVRLEHVSLSYDSSREALSDIDFEVLPGQTVAILGGPGSGKSTVVHLLPRFYDPSSGRVLIDGVDARDVTLASLRRNVGIVLQDVFAFSATIRDNIAYGAANASLDDVIRVSKLAQLDDFVEGLPDGYDTMLGERGVTLSGGQRQRLAIARTVLLDPPILVLDDSTSSVDVATESLIQRALDEVARDRTTFVIAHRLSTVRNADLILVLDRGKIVERGGHEELIARDGFYRGIHDLQLTPQAEPNLLDAAAPTVGDS